MMKLKIGIGFVTGRKLFKNVLKTYINNWLEHNLLRDENIEFHLFIAYDLRYKNTKVNDYRKIPYELANYISTINYYGVDDIKKEGQFIENSGVLTPKESSFIFGEGYAKKRNLVTYFAIKHKMDKLLFIDDDEYPVAVLQNPSKKLQWAGQSILSTHLKFNDDADISHGLHCGYISPIPYINFDKNLNESHFKNFIQAISNDIINWDTIRKVVINQKGVTYANASVINKEKVYEVKMEAGRKFISGANLCFNLKRFKKLPPFYNPPGARGEDTFMSTALEDIKVLKVPCYTFHDGFSMYNHILNGVLPTELLPIEVKNEEVLKRFFGATIGWIRYKPLLVYITDPKNFDKVMLTISRNLKTSIPRINEAFNTSDFNRIFYEFDHYKRNVKRHFQDFEKTKRIWAKLMQSMDDID